MASPGCNDCNQDSERSKLLSSAAYYGSNDSGGERVAPGDPPPRRLGGWLSSEPGEEEEELRRKLKYFFMSPCDKFHAKGRKPFKLGLQLLKIIIVTVQLVLFGLSNQMVVTFNEENTVSFKNIFLKDYNEDSDEPLAVYTQSDVYSHIQYAIEQYLALPETTVGRYAYVFGVGVNGSALSLCQRYFRKGSIDPANDTFDIDPHIVTECIGVNPLATPPGPLRSSYKNFTLQFYKLMNVTIEFQLKAINIQTIINNEIPDCYTFTVTIVLDNKAHSGQVKISLHNKASIQECTDPSVSGHAENYQRVVFDLMGGSSVPAVPGAVWGGPIIRGIFLQNEFVRFFSDVLTIIGSFIKIGIDSKNLSSYDVCGILLGTSTLLVWGGGHPLLQLLPEVQHPDHYPAGRVPQRRPLHLLRRRHLHGLLLLWVDRLTPLPRQVPLPGHGVPVPVLSHQRRRHVRDLHGDGGQQPAGVGLQPGVPLHLHLPLIYMVLSLFIALITGAYETIKHQTQEPEHVTELHAFIAECKDTPGSGKFRGLESGPCALFCCCGRTTTYEDGLLVN
ncbi:hypothetical protein SKAU_G00428880 [Synaphobranchus kaupii]|uniref:Mucolipin extracytosolic domain-containing protein n=1 Tax=Synaphobranchus kaupii TaxID=118154 RepID=A0A9Q1E4J3_SYNKA|nr:hypothetical protein SKAU_G00428880 [Synaphobranchus kaupii]